MSKKKVLAIDLETIADRSMIPFLPEVKANGNLKDPDKIKADIEEKQKKQIEDLGLSPAMNIICCAGYCDDNGPGHIMLLDEPDAGEKILLELFWELAAKYTHFVTYNGRSFDLRCLLLHGMTYGVRPSIVIDHGRYNRGNHTDLRQILAGEDKFAPGKLDFFAQKFLGDKKTEGIDGKAVQDFWDCGLHADIAKYCEQDCVLTYRLYEMAERCGLLE